MKVKLPTITRAQTLCKLATQCRGDVFVRSGRCIVDAKSILGIFSLDLTKPVDVITDYLSNEEEADFINGLLKESILVE